MNHRASIIHLGIAFDQNYLSPFYALVTSILKHNGDGNIVIHAIATGVPANEMDAIKFFVESMGAKISFYSINESQVAGFVLNSNWTQAVYYRLLFPFLVSGFVSRLLYIDTDTLVLNDLSAFFNTNLGGYPVGAVYDNHVKKQPLIGIEEEGRYFNSGVLLIDLPKWKQQQISEKAFEYLEQYPERIQFVDQCALNAVLIGNWKQLPGKYNCMTSLIPEGMNRSERKRFINDKVILHFTLQRPWNYLCKHPYRQLYKYYLKQSPSIKKKLYTDFSYRKVPNFIKIQLLDWYMKSPLIQQIWRKLKF